MVYQTVKATELFASGLPARQIMIDVRTPAEFRHLHLPKSVSMPLDALNVSEIMALQRQRETDGILLICQSGQRATRAAEKLADEIASPVRVVEGGLNEIEKLGIELSPGNGKQVISIERQTRIAAGTLMLLGVLGSLWIHPGFLWLSGFVGAGLIFAGVTNSCAMGLLLARMPWNR